MKKRFIFAAAAAVLAFALLYLAVGSTLPAQLLQSYAISRGEKITCDNADCPEFEAIMPRLCDTRLFLMGETHGVAKNYDLQYKYIEFLCKNGGLDYILLETGFSASQLLNQYLKSGDEQTLDFVMRQFEGSFAYTEDFYNFIKKIRALNLTLEENFRLEFVGIDAEQQPALAVSYIDSIMPEGKPVPENIQWYIATLRITPEICNNYSFMNEFFDSFKTYKADYVEYFGDDYDKLYHTVSNSLDYMSNKITARRDDVLTRNFCQLYSHLPQGRYFASLGLLHVLKADDETQYTPFVTAVENSLPDLKGKIFTLVLRYAQSEYLHPTNGAEPLNDFALPVIYSSSAEAIFYYDDEVSDLKSTMAEPLLPERYGDAVVLVLNSAAASEYTPKIYT